MTNVEEPMEMNLIAAALIRHDPDVADCGREFLDMVSREWERHVGTADGVHAWLSAGLHTGHADCARRLISLGVLPSELCAYPCAVILGILRCDDNERASLVAIGRIATSLRDATPTLPALSADEENALWSRYEGSRWQGWDTNLDSDTGDRFVFAAEDMIAITPVP